MLESILSRVESLDITKLATQRTTDIAKSVLKRNSASIDEIIPEEGTDRIIIVLKLDKLYQFYVTLEFNPFFLHHCTCGILWHPKKKICLHTAIILWGLSEKLFDLNKINDKGEKKEKIEKALTTIENVRKIFITKLLSDLDIPESISSVLDELEKIIVIFLENGTQRISQTTLEWLNTLIIRAHTHKLIKIEKSLKKLQTIFLKYLEKSVADDTTTFLSLLTEIHNFIMLTKFILDNPQHPYLPAVAILGQARSEYFSVNDINQCLLLGIEGWISDTGMVGVTAYFITFDKNENISDNFFTASNIRPIQNIPEKSPIMLYGFKTYSEITFRDLSKESLYSIRNVKFNQNKNLSFHKNLEINPIRLNLNEIKTKFLYKITYSDWYELLDKIQNKPLSPIGERDNDFLFLLEPSRYVSFELDYISQKWKSPLIDKNGKLLYLIVPNENSPHIANKIKNFQLMFNQNKLPNALFGKLDFLEDEVVFYPISGWFYQGFTAKGKYGSTVTRISYNLDVDIGAEYIFT